MDLKEAYDKYAEQYAAYLEDRPPQFELTEFSGMLSKGAKVLDAGCAAGRDSLYLIEDGFKVVGIDISEKLLNMAKANVKGAEFLQMDIGKLSFDDESFDGIWCFDSFAHVSAKEADNVLKGFARVLKPGGILFLVAPSGKGEGEEERKELMGEKVFFAYHDHKELQMGLTKSGFEVVKAYSGEELIIMIGRK